MNKTQKAKSFLIDLMFAIGAGIVVGTAYHFFQNSNGFAPGGVGGLATIIHHLLQDKVSWSVLMISFNIPIFILVAAFIDKKLGFFLSVYIMVQSVMPYVFNALGFLPYCLKNSGEDFNIIFASIATGVISGFGFSLMLMHFGASGGTYGISALIKKWHPEANIAYVAFIMDSSVVFISYFVYGMKLTPVICTLMNLFIASVIVDKGIGGLKIGYKFEIITTHPNELSGELLSKLKHGVTEISVHGMYSDTDRYMLICIINKRQMGEMIKILKSYPDTFACFSKASEVFGNFKRKV